MSVEMHPRATSRRRVPAKAGYGVGTPLRPEAVDDFIQVTRDPAPWAARKLDHYRVFRGRLHPGTARLPSRAKPRGERGVTLGLASRPIVLRSVGVAHPIPANTPWLVLSDTEWRITVTEPTDLRLLHGHGLDRDLLDAVITEHRPTRFQTPEAKIVRAALRSATPSWIDGQMQSVKDLAAGPETDWRVVAGREPSGSQYQDHFKAFVLLITWALEQQATREDPRFVSVVRHVTTYLADPAMSTVTIAEQLMISRRTLQSLFEAHGGLAAYIRRQRLSAVLSLLTESSTRFPDLEEVATLTGLGSRRTLERAMRQVYGLTPRQARAQVFAGHQLRERESNELRAS